jgi:hypothetical protein
MGKACGMYGDEKRCLEGFGGNCKVNRLLGCPRNIWKDNIKRDLQEVKWGGMDWIDVAQNRNK